MAGRLTFPEGRPFAFTILDDTDDTTVANGRPIYDLLHELGMRTTKTVWAIDVPPERRGIYFAAETLQNPRYREWVRQLAAQGFEVAFHNAAMASSRREETERALDLIGEEFPGMPRLHCNHGQNQDNLYWGPARYSRPEIASAWKLLGSLPYEGHVPDSPYFWGDIAQTKINYVRRFAYFRFDSGGVFPHGPFQDPATPYVRCWFNTSDASNVMAFRHLVTVDAIRRLRDRGSWSVVSTHLGKGFVRDGSVDPEVERVLRYAAELGGWFVPVSELMDHLVQTLGCPTLTRLESARMEYAHVWDRIMARITGMRSPRPGET